MLKLLIFTEIIKFEKVKRRRIDTVKVLLINLTQWYSCLLIGRKDCKLSSAALKVRKIFVVIVNWRELYERKTEWFPSLSSSPIVKFFCVCLCFVSSKKHNSDCVVSVKFVEAISWKFQLWINLWVNYSSGADRRIICAESPLWHMFVFHYDDSCGIVLLLGMRIRWE